MSHEGWESAMSWRGYLGGFLLMAGVGIVVGFSDRWLLQGPGFLCLFFVVPSVIAEVEWRAAQRRHRA